MYRACPGTEYDHSVDIYTAPGIAFTMACYSFPYVFVLGRTRSTTIRRIWSTPRRSSGAAGAHVRRITLPMILPYLAGR